MRRRLSSSRDQHPWYRLVCSVLFALLYYACATTPDLEDLRNAEAHYRLGASYIAKNQLNKAFLEFQKAIKLNPKHKESLNYLGYISTRFQKYDDAVYYYERALSVDPNYSEAMNNLGATYAEIGEWDEALKYFKMALNNPLYPTPERVYLNMGFVYYKRGEYQRALDSLKTAITLDPEFPQAFYLLGLVHVAIGENEIAITEFKRAIDLVPEYMEAHWELAFVYLREGDREGAIRHFSVVAEKERDTSRGKEAMEYLEMLGR